jgi:hypothetical protein
MKIKESSCDSFNFMKRPFSAAFLGRLFIVMGPTALCAHIVMAYLMVVDRRQRNFRAVTSNIAAKHGGGDHGGLFRRVAFQVLALDANWAKECKLRILLSADATFLTLD